MIQKNINKILISNFGIGVSLSHKIHKQLGLNLRESPIFVKIKHKEKIDIKYLKNRTGKNLKNLVQKSIFSSIG